MPCPTSSRTPSERPRYRASCSHSAADRRSKCADIDLNSVVANVTRLLHRVLGEDIVVSFTYSERAARRSRRSGNDRAGPPESRGQRP